MYHHLTWEQCVMRFPRLASSLQWVACLSLPEAGCAIRDYRDAREASNGRSPFPDTRHEPDLWRVWGEDMLAHGGGEAVAHYGGPRKAVQRAVQVARARYSRA